MERRTAGQALLVQTQAGACAAEPGSQIRVSRPRAYIVAACAVVLAALGSPSRTQAQTALPLEKLSWNGDPAAPDLSGVWVRADAAGVPSTSTPASKSGSKEGWQPWPPPLAPNYAAIWQKRVADTEAGQRTDDPIRSCLPPGMPRFITGTNGPLLIIQTPGRVTMYRDGDPVRRIWLNGRTLPDAADLESFSNGNAVGHYESSKLVTEVAGFKDYPIDGTGIPHSGNLKVVEHYRRVDAKTLEVEVELTDPAAYAMPMTTTVTFTAFDNPLWEPKEVICSPNVDYHPDTYVH